MWNTPSQERLAKLPRLYETGGIAPKDKLVFLHFFIGWSDWYAVEFDGEDLFFGYAILNGDTLNAEWGYFSLSELMSVQVSEGYEIDCELQEYWEVRPAWQVQRISHAQGWRHPALAY